MSFAKVNLYYTGCENITINCSRGSQCKVDETTHQAYCEASCDLDNGGCAADEVCFLLQESCISDLCPPVAQCLSKLMVTSIELCMLYYHNQKYIAKDL